MRRYQDYAPPQRKSTRHPDRACLNDQESLQLIGLARRRIECERRLP